MGLPQSDERMGGAVDSRGAEMREERRAAAVAAAGTASVSA